MIASTDVTTASDGRIRAALNATQLDDKQVEWMQRDHAMAVYELCKKFEAGYWRST